MSRGVLYPLDFRKRTWNFGEKSEKVVATGRNRHVCAVYCGIIGRMKLGPREALLGVLAIICLPGSIGPGYKGGAF